MDVQTLFFGLGSAFMILGILTLLVTLIVLLVIWRKIIHLHRNISEKVEEFNEATIKPVKRASDVVTSILSRKRN